MARQLQDNESYLIHYHGSAEGNLSASALEVGELAIVHGGSVKDTFIKTLDRAGEGAELAKFITEDAVKDLIKDSTAAEVSVVSTATTEGYLKSYQIMQFGEVAGTIDIPKDFLLKSGEVKVVTEADQPYAGAVVGDKYLDMIINVKSGSTEDEHIYIPVKDLVDVYTGDGNTIEISNTNVVSVKANVFETSGAAHEEKVRAMAKEADLAQAITDEETRATSAETALGTRIDNLKASEVAATAYTYSTQTAKGVPVEVNLTGATVQKDLEEITKAIAYTDVQILNMIDDLSGESHTHKNMTVLNDISAEKVAAWDAVAEKKSDYDDHLADDDIHVTTEDKTKWNNAEKNAKDYTDGLLGTGFSTTDTVAKAIEAANGAVATEKSRAEGKEAELNTAIGAEETRAKGAESALDTKIDGLNATNLKMSAAEDAMTIAAAIQDAKENGGVKSLDGKKGALTVTKGSTTEGAVNFAVSADDGVLSGQVVLTETTQNIANNAQAIADEEARAKKAEGDLNTAVTANTSAIESEVSRATGVESTLSGAIDTNKTAIETEKGRAEDAESALDAKISANTKAIADEAGRASDAEGELSDRIDALEAISGQSHTHANKALLDTYTQTEENLADAVAKKHEHENKTVLDGISAEKVTAWDAAEKNAKDYADEEIAKAIASETARTETAYAKKATTLAGYGITDAYVTPRSDDGTPATITLGDKVFTEYISAISSKNSGSNPNVGVTVTNGVLEVSVKKINGGTF